MGTVPLGSALPGAEMFPSPALALRDHALAGAPFAQCLTLQVLSATV